MAGEKENVITHTYDLLKYVIPQLEKFPRSQKFVLADKIQNQLTDILGMLIEAYYTGRGEKGAILQKTNIELEKLRYYVRLAHDTRCINLSRYEFIQGKLNDIGAQVGAWRKSMGH
jgi:hypothetical protein